MRFTADSTVAAVTTASTTAPVDANANVTGQSIRPLSPQAYFVRRTPSEFLPVYNEAKRGGNLKQTKLRKISGDIKRLANDLQAYLELSEKDIVVNRDTQSIVVKVRNQSLPPLHSTLI